VYICVSLHDISKGNAPHNAPAIAPITTNCA
jgi:hypothetical protein